MRVHRFRATLAALLAASTLILTWNAWHYPWNGGYDAAEHAAYADYLFERGALPTARTNEHYYTPPGYYAVAGAIDWTAMQLGRPEPQPRRLVQLLNVPLVVGTALLTFLLARQLWPGRRFLQLAALAFFAFAPVVIKTGAMYHPENLSLFVSTLGLYLAARMIVQRQFSWPAALAVGVVLGAGQLVRSQGAWTFIAVAIALLVLALRGEAPRRAVAASLAGLVIGTAAVAGWWYVRQDVFYGSPLDFTHTAFTAAGVHPGAAVGPWTRRKPLWERRPLSFYVDPGLPEVFSRPYRPAYVGSGIPVTYTEVWGDWLGAWKDGSASTGVRRELRTQSVIGLLPTLLALAGWVGLIVAAARTRAGASPAVVLVPAMIAVSLLGYAYFVVDWPSPDGDVLKATYLITSVPAWAIAAAYALDRIPRSPRLLLTSLLVLAALAELPFVVW